MTAHTIKHIAEAISGTVDGDDTLVITGLEQIDLAEPGQMTFVGTQVYARQWSASRATAAVVSRDITLQSRTGTAVIRVDNADLAMAAALALFEPSRPQIDQGVHAGAHVDPTAKIAKTASIGPGCVVGAHVRVDADCILYANVTVMDHAVVGAGSVLWPGAWIGPRCEVGDRCIIHANVNIGADGFGFRRVADTGEWVKIPHIGTVCIGHDVELGAGTCIDRGKFSATTIGHGTKIDNLVQIGHNCRIGRHCVISGMVAIGGTTTIGDGVMIGGKAGVRDHMTVGDGAMISGGAQVFKDVASGQCVAGIPARDAKETMKIWAALPRIPGLLRALKQPGSDLIT